MESVKANIISVIGSSKNGLPLNSLIGEYKSLTGENLNCFDLGFKSVKELLTKIPEIAIVESKDTPHLVLNKKSFNSSSLTLLELVNRTKSTKKKTATPSLSKPKYPISKPKPLRDHSHKSPLRENRYQNNSDSRSSYQTDILPNNFKIHVKNDLCHDKKWGLADIDTDSSSEASDQENRKPYYQSNSVILMVKLYNPNNKYVKVLRIYSGYGIVVNADYKLKHQTLRATRVSDFILGDYLIWQSHVVDLTQQLESTINMDTAFIVVAIKPINKFLVKVRLLGTSIVLDISITELYYFSIDDFKDNTAMINSKNITIIPLLEINELLNLEHNENLNFFDKVYRAIYLSDYDKYILENSERRGEFLNIGLLRHFYKSMILNVDSQTRFYIQQSLIYSLDDHLASFNDYFLKLLVSKTYIQQDSDVLLFAFNDNQCKGKMLIGDLDIISEIDTNCIHLERVTYSTSTGHFYLYDKDSRLYISKNSPLYGVYVLNERCVKSPSLPDKVRFSISYVMNMPKSDDVYVNNSLRYP